MRLSGNRVGYFELAVLAHRARLRSIDTSELNMYVWWYVKTCITNWHWANHSVTRLSSKLKDKIRISSYKVWNEKRTFFLDLEHYGHIIINRLWKKTSAYWRLQLSASRGMCSAHGKIGLREETSRIKLLASGRFWLFPRVRKEMWYSSLFVSRPISSRRHLK